MLEAAPRTGEPQLWLRLLGTLAVCRAGVVTAAAEVGSRKARMLLALLAVQPGQLIPIDRIVDVLWAESPPRRPAANVATLVSRLRSALGSEAIAGGRSGYRLGDSVRVDLYTGAALVSRADARMACGELTRALASARAALNLLDNGGVLDDAPDAQWAAPARALYSSLQRRGRQIAAQAALLSGDLWGARATAEAGVAADPLDEAAHRTLMLTLAASGEPARALVVYERLRTTLATELGIDPAAATRDLHLAILQDRVAPVAMFPGTARPTGVVNWSGVARHRA